MKKRHIWVSVPVTLLTLLMASASFSARAADTAKNPFTAGKFGVSFRWRLENVDQDPLPHDATAAPLRVRLNYTTADMDGFSLKAEFDYIYDLGMDNYNAAAGNKPNTPGYPVIADPAGKDWNQAYLQYNTGFGGVFRAGRQRIIYDNARFVGNVGWRQNEQTYDAFSFSQKTTGGLTFQYAYVDKVNRIFGDKVSAGEHAQNTNLFNLSYVVEGLGKFTAYYYDINNKDAAALSNTTWGLRFGGSTSAAHGPKFGYGLEYANQHDNANNPVDYEADYWRADLSVGFSLATLYAGYESLEGDQNMAGQAFRTPLATLHAFNGWADKFLATPAAGLEDAFVGVKGKLGPWKWNVLYHDFSAQSGSADFGTEFDASIGRKFMDHFGILFKAASFSSDSPSYGDTTKLWVMLSANY